MPSRSWLRSCPRMRSIVFSVWPRANLTPTPTPHLASLISLTSSPSTRPPRSRPLRPTIEGWKAVARWRTFTSRTRSSCGGLGFTLRPRQTEVATTFDKQSRGIIRGTDLYPEAPLMAVDPIHLQDAMWMKAQAPPQTTLKTSTWPTRCLTTRPTVA